MRLADHPTPAWRSGAPNALFDGLRKTMARSGVQHGWLPACASYALSSPRIDSSVMKCIIASRRATCLVLINACMRRRPSSGVGREEFPARPRWPRLTDASGGSIERIFIFAIASDKTSYLSRHKPKGLIRRRGHQTWLDSLIPSDTNTPADDFVRSRRGGGSF
jgi:hypothetical protein